MRIAYLSTDEVNRELTTRWADERNIHLVLVDREALPADGSLDAALCDLDYLPSERRQEILDTLLAGASPCPMAVHGYNLDDTLAENLRACGVLVVRRHSATSLDRLCREVCDEAPRELRGVRTDAAVIWRFGRGQPPRGKGHLAMKSASDESAVAG